MLAELYVTRGREAGKALELSPGSSVSFGRALSNDVRIRDAQVSRVHCRFECTEDGLRLKDMSGNGTLVNEERVKGGEVLLKDGDEVRLGQTVVRVLVESAAEKEERAALAALREEDPSDAEALLSDTALDEVKPAARALGQPKITLADLQAQKRARARRADVPPPADPLPLPPPAPARPADHGLREVIPGYRIEAKLGGGGRKGTVVYRALQLSLDRPVALKVLLPVGAQDEQQLGRFLREQAAIARLHHPNIVTIHDAGRAGERRFIVMELLTGGSAGDRIEDQGALPLEESLQLALDVARALAYAHDRGTVHRSVRAANVLRDAHGAWKLVDFGMSRDALRGGGGETNFIDAPLEAVAYLAPEQVNGGPVDARGDVYAAGALLYHALTGKPPFWGDSIAAVASAIEAGELAAGPLDAAAPGALATVVRRALAHDPKERYADGQTLLHELAAAQAAIRPGPRAPRARAT